MKLHRIIRANSLFSSLSGMGISVFKVELGHFIGYQNDILFLVIGIGLILFGFSLAYLSTLQSPAKSIFHVVILMDLSWVMGSITILIIPEILTANGKLLVAGLALVVLSLAIAQSIALKRSYES